MKPLVSIVLAVYNGSRYLETQIRSILNQSYENIELVIVDDGSSDDSFRIVERLAQAESRLKIHRNPRNVGFVKNFLGALRFAMGELVCFSDQDDVWRKDKVEILSSLILRDCRNMFAYSDMEICDEELRTIFPSFWKASGIWPRGGMLRELALLRNIAPGCSMMFRKEVRDLLLRVPPNCSFLHDHLAFIFAASSGKIVYTLEKLVKYRQHAANNIGAFYPSVTDKQRFHEQLKKEIGLLRPLLPANIIRLERFLESDAVANIFSRASFIRYYLFLRCDTLASKGLGILECFFPNLYQLLRRGFRTNRFL